MGNLRYGLDNWIWATCGYSGGKVKVGDSEIRFSACIFRFKPDGSAFEVITPTESNTWGLGFSETGEILASKANDAHQVQIVESQLRAQKIEPYEIDVVMAPEDVQRRVLIGRFTTRKEADAMLEKLGLAFPGARVIPGWMERFRVLTSDF
jgi:hypothetical protein